MLLGRKMSQIYISETSRFGNSSFSYTSQHEANERLKFLDANNNQNCTLCVNLVDCRNCHQCAQSNKLTNCTECASCSQIWDCTGCEYCVICVGCVDCENCANQIGMKKGHLKISGSLIETIYTNYKPITTWFPIRR